MQWSGAVATPLRTEIDHHKTHTDRDTMMMTRIPPGGKPREGEPTTDPPDAPGTAGLRIEDLAPPGSHRADDPIFDPADPPSPADPMPADPRDCARAIAYWRARGARPSWADRVDADLLVTRAELRAALAQPRAQVDRAEGAA